MGMYTLLYLKWITNKDLLYSTWNSAQGYVAAWMGGEFGRECMCVCVCVCVCVHAQSLQLCPTLCDPMDCSLPGFSVHGILQARILEWVAMPSSRGFSQPRDQNRVSCIACISGRFLTTKPPREPVCVRVCVCVHACACVYVCMTVSLHCSPEIVTILLIGYTPIQNKKLKKTNSQQTKVQDLKTSQVNSIKYLEKS